MVSCNRLLGALLALALALWIGRKTAPRISEVLPPEASVKIRTEFPALAEMLFDMGKQNGTLSTARPGMSFAGSKKHPVVFVPGITSCALEIWKAMPCLGDSHFRRRVWGDFAMAEAVLKNWTCWLEHIKLDLVTGLDRDGVKVKPASGLGASDYFIGGYWIWAKIIQNLADIGYDESDMHLACYDWRLTYSLLEERDHFFSGLQRKIEFMLEQSGEKAVLIPHSMGSTVTHYFFNFVEQRSPGWVDRHIEAVVSLGGSYLGAMGPLAGYMSGEMDATAALGPLGTYIEKLAITWDEIREIYWSFGGLAGLLPKGGSPVWGSAQSGFTDTPAEVIEVPEGMQMSSSMSLEYIYDYGGSNKDRSFTNYKSIKSYNHQPHLPGAGEAISEDKFANPLASPLPNAPNMKIYCLYGVGLQTERAYKYGIRQVRWAWADSDSLSGRMWSSTRSVPDIISDMRWYAEGDTREKAVLLDAGSHRMTFPRVMEAVEYLESMETHVDNPEQWMRINGSYNTPDDGPLGNGVDGVFKSGVAKTDGDGTVPLASLGYMCKYGWRELPEFNPGNVKTVVKEVKHEPCSLLEDPRGGPKSAKHVEIIGNHEVIADILHIVSGSTDHNLQEDRIISNLTQWGPSITARLKEFFAKDRD